MKTQVSSCVLHIACKAWLSGGARKIDKEATTGRCTRGYGRLPVHGVVSPAWSNEIARHASISKGGVHVESGVEHILARDYGQKKAKDKHLDEREKEEREKKKQKKAKTD
jgi:hypothetical protein